MFGKAQTTFHRVRAATAAGRFYPRDPQALRQLVEALLAEVPPFSGPAPKAVIVPHAGYIYSGPVAASAFARFAPEAALIKRVVLLGPSHFVALDGLAASSAEAFATPLGNVPVDVAAVRTLTALPQFQMLDAAHQNEHSLEVQLPFLQVLLDDFALVPLAVGQASPGMVSQVLEALWDGPETRLVISSDLSHYLNSEAARRLDGCTAAAIEALNPEGLLEGQACGRASIRGLLLAARTHGLQAQTIDLRNSGDTSGPRDRVVGYGAFAFQT